jgi:methylthioribose-1-phosphate isomerase
MNINGRAWRSIWLDRDGWSVGIIDQTALPHLLVRSLRRRERSRGDLRDGARRLLIMPPRPAAGAACARAGDASLGAAAACWPRPSTAGTGWALQHAPATPAAACRRPAAATPGRRDCRRPITTPSASMDYGLRGLWRARQPGQDRLRILTHCNAGWLATVDWGTALAPIYRAHDEGIPLHVWVDETRPRNQGAALTAWELQAHGVPHDVVVDSAGGHLMQQNLVDLCLTGTDRTARNGDVCNKIGTYLKALAARDTGVPFYVALPGPSIDWAMGDGFTAMPIEERDPREVTEVQGRLAGGGVATVQIAPRGVTARNFAFDVTPARLVSGLLTERGVCAASEAGLMSLYPERGGLST